jgi:hypothetical protein
MGPTTKVNDGLSVVVGTLVKQKMMNFQATFV